MRSGSLEHRRATGRLGGAMRIQVAPRREAGVIAPELQREQLVRIREALKRSIEMKPSIFASSLLSWAAQSR